MSLQPDTTAVYTSNVVSRTTAVATTFSTGPNETSAVAPVFTEYPGPVGNSPSGVIHSKSNINAGAIAGGVVGGLAVIAIAIVVLYWIRRRYPKVRHEETEAVPAPPHYDMPPPNMSGIAQPAHVSTGEQPTYMSAGEQPTYVYKSEGLSAKEEMNPFSDGNHGKGLPVNKKR